MNRIFLIYFMLLNMLFYLMLAFVSIYDPSAAVRWFSEMNFKNLKTFNDSTGRVKMRRTKRNSDIEIEFHEN